MIQTDLLHQKEPKKGAWILLCAFLLSGVLLTSAYWAYGFYPFGQKSLLIMDMSDQYVEFYAGLRYVGKNASILFSWSKGFGQNQIGLFAYYLSSPFSVLVLLFPADQITTALLWINVLKIACCGLTFAIFLHEWNQKWEYSQILFGLCYALTSYTVVYSMCLMWLDGVIWLPLVLAGVVRVLRKNRPLLLLGSFTVLFVSNYYISFMVFLFAVLFFLYLYFGEEMHETKPREFVSKLGMCAGCVILAGGLGAWLLLPTLLSLLQGKVSGAATASIASGVQFPLIEFFGKLLAGEYDSITNSGLPSVYCGSAVLTLAASFFLSAEFRVKTKLLAGGLLALLLFSFWWAPLDTVWHVCQTPNWFPYRYAFVFSFFLLFLAFRGAQSFYNMPLTRKISTAVAGFLLLLFCDFCKKSSADAMLYLSLLLSGAVLLALLLHHRPRWMRIAAFAAVLIILSAELFQNTIAMVSGLNRQFGYKTESSYEQFQQQLFALTDLAEQDSGEALFYRMEKDYERSKNDAIGAGYNGITHYSSAYNQAVNRLTPQIGLSQYHFWNSYYGATPVTDALFAVKYLMMKGDVCGWYESVGKVDSITLWRNPDALSVAFAANRGARDSEGLTSDVLANQQLLLNELTGTDAEIWEPAELVQTELSHVKESVNGGYHVYTKQASGTATVSYQFRTAQDGALYAYFPTNGTSRCGIRVNEADFGVHFTSETCQTVYLGTFAAGEEVRVAFTLQNDSVSIGTPSCATLNEAVFRSTVHQLSEQQLELTSFSASALKGTITTDKDGVLFTSIPFDSGWTVKIDGKKVEVFAWQGTFLMTELPSGAHTIEMTYAPAGFFAGILLSVGSAGILILLLLLRFRRRKGQGTPRSALVTRSEL